MAEAHYGAHGRHLVLSRVEMDRAVEMSVPKQQYGGEIGDWLGMPFYLDQCPWDCESSTFEVTQENIALILGVENEILRWT